MNEIANIISRLENQKAAIDRALEALQDFAATGSITPEQSGRKTRSARKGGMTPEGRRRLALAMKRRWAAKRTGKQAKATAKKATAKKATAKKVTAKKAGLSAAGRQKLAEAMKRRWAAKRTAAQAKKKAA